MLKIDTIIFLCEFETVEQMACAETELLFFKKILLQRIHLKQAVKWTAVLAFGCSKHIP